MITDYALRAMGQLRLSQDMNTITVHGVNKSLFYSDVTNHYKTTTVGNNIFLPSNMASVKFEKFFAMEIVHIVQEMINNGQRVRTPKRLLIKFLDLMEETWIGKSMKDVGNRSLADLSSLDKYAVFKPLKHQKEFIQHYLVAKDLYDLRGYMLDSEPGTGKTMTNLYLAHLQNPSGVRFWIVPKKAADEVWAKTIRESLVEEETYWCSLDNQPLKLGYQNYIVHYDFLPKFHKWVVANRNAFHNVYVGLDESHNFNRMDAARTQMFVDIANQPFVDDVLWSSGTPISAIGKETIPFMKTVTRNFTKRAEAGFSKIFTKNARKANDILRHRIGNLKYFIPASDSMDFETHEFTHKVKFQGGERFTLKEIRREMEKYVAERTKHYEANRETYQRQYDHALAIFQRSKAYQDNPGNFDKYRSYVRIIQRGYDPKEHKAYAMYCNDYELKTIVPTLPSVDAKAFKGARSVIKYVHLKIVGEALGVLGRYRSACFSALVPHAELPMLIDNAKKKTIIFTSYVDVVKTTERYLTSQGFKPICIYGETNKDLKRMVNEFFTNDDANPVIATYDSLSEAVPMFVANRIIMLNQPWRARTRTQSIARAARLGQDSDVDVFSCVLDTGEVENISTRTQEIMEWSAEMVMSIMGKDNVDVGLAMESSIPDEDMEYVLDLVSEEAKVEDVADDPKVPLFLYHGSMFAQDTLRPGIYYTGKEVKWDGIESNRYLYASTCDEEAKLLGFGSALEKTHDVVKFSYDAKAREMEIHTANPVTLDELMTLPVYLYRIRGDYEEGWRQNFNVSNGIRAEWKTENHIEDNIVSREIVLLDELLAGWSISVHS